MRFVLRRNTVADVTRRIGYETAQPKGNTMLTKKFGLDALERAVKTFAQSLLSVLTLDGANVLSLDWGQTLSLAGTATLVSLLTSVVSLPLGDNGTASVVNDQG